MSDDEWWNTRSPLLAELAGEDWAEHYPTLTRLEQQRAFAQADRSPDDATPYLEYEERAVFEFGLARLLDGIEAFVVDRA